MAAVAIVLGLCLRLYHIDAKTMWDDEIYGLIHTLGFTEAQIVTAGPHVRSAADLQAYYHLEGPAPGGARPLSATWQSLAEDDPQHPPLYYGLARLWVGVAGTSVLALRTLPVLFGLLAIGAIAWLAWELLDSGPAALIAASLYALSPHAVLYSQEAREYSLWALEIIVSSALLLRAARTGRPWIWGAYGAVALLGLYTFPVMAFVMVAHLVGVLAVPAWRSRRVLGPYLAASAGASLLYLPWLITLAESRAARHGLESLLSGRSSAWRIGLTFVREIKASVLDVGAIDDPAWHLAATAGGALVLALIGAALLHLYRDRRRDPARPFLYGLLVVPGLPLQAHDLIAGGQLYGQLRYFEPAFIAVCVALAALLAAHFDEPRATSAPRRRLTTEAWLGAYAGLLAAGALSCGIGARAATWYNKAYERTPAVAAIINAGVKPVVLADTAVTHNRGNSRVLQLAYYLAPDIAMRVNLHCDNCLLPAPPPRDLFADLGEFREVYVLGPLRTPAHALPYRLYKVGIDMDPGRTGPLNMFDPYPR